MTKLIDGDRLEEYLRQTDGLDALLIQLVLDDFIYTPPQTPMGEITRPVKEIVRRHDPGTSWEAAYAVSSEKRQLLFRLIYRALTVAPRTDDELHEVITRARVPHSESGLRTRRSELVAAGWVRDSGEKRSSANGHPATVWEAVPEVLS